ncbi:hypothetical protein CBI36_02000 [Acetobacter oryzifermentans]|uniref:Uncharacterized protein n=2 Tax=Acetobacter TaxID=434 RepID=A0AAN1U9Z9_9PROT|nr:hypothetical protein CBI36_02000 [Acetobacter oryzifermentans]AXN01464.1 hypothetical protein CJF59_13565 [Acetobacter pomorum]
MNGGDSVVRAEGLVKGSDVIFGLPSDFKYLLCNIILDLVARMFVKENSFLRDSLVFCQFSKKKVFFYVEIQFCTLAQVTKVRA